MEKCSICLEEKNNKDIIYKCNICKDGIVCCNCINYLDPNGTIFGDEEYIKKAIKCPCCRALNWKYHFSQFISVVLEYEIFHCPFDEVLPAFKIFYKNADIDFHTSCGNCEECEKDYHTWWESNYCEECR